MQHTSYTEEVETVGISRLDKDNIIPFSSRVNFNSETIVWSFSFYYKILSKRKKDTQKKRHKENQFWDIVSEETHNSATMDPQPHWKSLPKTYPLTEKESGP